MLVTSALFTDCRSGKKKSNPITEEVIAPDHFIRVGKSGGYTALSKVYSLSPTGNVMQFSRLEGNEIAKFVGKISTADCSLLYKSLRTLKLSEYTVKTTGNITYFIREIKGDSTYEVSWGIEQKDVPEPLKNYYQLFMSKIPQ